MITKEQCFNGIIKFLDAEVMPALPTSGKWIAGAMITIASTNYTKIINELSANSLVKSLGVVDDSGLIDAEKVLCALADSSKKYGTLELSLPMIGLLRFTTRDVEKLKEYMI